MKKYDFCPWGEGGWPVIKLFTNIVLGVKSVCKKVPLDGGGEGGGGLQPSMAKVFYFFSFFTPS